tara:strand:+ start:26342 stop:26515 length:174 start_codon:yes stop_codon:yes gene_type:complete
VDGPELTLAGFGYAATQRRSFAESAIRPSRSIFNAWMTGVRTFLPFAVQPVQLEHDD